MKILVLHGPNLQLLGSREPGIYGNDSLDEINEKIKHRAAELGVEVECAQHNDEGGLVTRIGNAPGVYDGLLFNPAAYTHTSVALCDALRAVDVPCVEVHLSNTASRESYRHESLTASACIGQVMGFGGNSYLLALDGLVKILNEK